MFANTPSMLEAHYGVPMAGAVLHSINTRLDAEAIAFMLDHAGAKVLIGDTEFGPVLKQALKQTKVKPLLIDYRDLECGVEGTAARQSRLRGFHRRRRSGLRWSMPEDEWNAISLNYTSGTTGNPKGVVYHHRGAALMCYSNTLATGMGQHPIYLWTLPMFHCNGWCFPWAISLVCRHACLPQGRPRRADLRRRSPRTRSPISAAPPSSWPLCSTHRRRSGSRSTHRVAFDDRRRRLRPPLSSPKMDEAGFDLTHLYGLTETYGPATV